MIEKHEVIYDCTLANIELGYPVPISPGGIQDKTHKKIWLNRFAKNNPSKRMGKPDELFNALIYLINDKSSYNNGSNIIVDGGWTAW